MHKITFSFCCNFQSCCYDIILSSTACMSGLAVKKVFLRSFYKSGSVSQTLTSSYCNLMEIMANSTAQQKCNQAAMETFLETYYNPSNTCEIPLCFQSENLQCENNSQTVLGTDACIETPICLKDKYTADRQRYKAMRQWKRVKKGKIITFIVD